MIPNPWLIVAFLVALAGAAGGGGVLGHSLGEATQLKTDTAKITAANDKVADMEGKLALQKATANKQLQDDFRKIIATMAENDELKNKLETQHAQDTDINNTLSRQLATSKLQFRTPIAGAGHCGSSTGSAEGNTTSNEQTEVVQVPEALTTDLRQFAHDADDLNADYIECYNYTHKDQPFTGEEQ